MSLLNDIEVDVAKAAVGAALDDFLKGAVTQGKITALQAAYIKEGAADAVTLAFNELIGGK